jgi:hypothetical protein
MFQYPDDIVIYASGNILQRVRELPLQESLNSVDVFLSDLGLYMSATKFEMVFLSKK